MKGLLKHSFSIKESKGTIISDTQTAIDSGLASLEFHRTELRRFLKLNPVFHYSFEPVRISNGPRIVKLMSEAAEKAGVGPMAAVAGALADLSVEAMIDSGTKVAVVENGGEISLKSDRPIDIALQIGSSELSKKIGFRITKFPFGVATSSGVYSHAFSFGDAEALTVFTRDATLADASATAACNVVIGKDVNTSVKKGVEKALSIPGIEGVVVIYQGTIGMGGNIPEIINVNTN